MRIQFQILFFIVCLNLATGLVVVLGLPGTAYVSPTPPTSDTTEYEGHFNATEIAKGWSATPFSGVPIIGDICGAFDFFFWMIVYLIDGFPQLLSWISATYVTDASAQTTSITISWALRALYAIMMAFFVVEFIGGRYATD